MAIAPLDRTTATDLTSHADLSGHRDNPERPILLDLMSVGVYVNSVWDLVHSPAPFARAQRVLRRHLESGAHPAEVREALRQALSRRV